MNRLAPSRALALLAVTLLAGCAGSPRTPVDADPATAAGTPAAAAASPLQATSLEARAEQRWSYLINGQPEKAYDFLSPGYRETRSRDEYAEIMRNRPVRWSAADFQDQDCEGEVCKVRLMISFSLEMPVQMVGKVESIDFVIENWLWIDDNWYLLPATEVQKDLR